MMMVVVIKKSTAQQRRKRNENIQMKGMEILGKKGKNCLII